jgi:hypothetical protein
MAEYFLKKHAKHTKNPENVTQKNGNATGYFWIVWGRNAIYFSCSSQRIENPFYWFVARQFVRHVFRHARHIA